MHLKMAPEFINCLLKKEVFYDNISRIFLGMSAKFNQKYCSWGNSNSMSYIRKIFSVTDRWYLLCAPLVFKISLFSKDILYKYIYILKIN